MADAFLARFQLKPEEVQILRGTRDGVLHPVSSGGKRAYGLMTSVTNVYSGNVTIINKSDMSKWNQRHFIQYSLNWQNLIAKYTIYLIKKLL